MRVAFVTEQTVFHDGTEGRERVHRLAAALADRGHDVTVFCSRWWPDDVEFWERDGVRFRAVTVDTAISSFVTRVPVLLALFRPDVVHTTPAPPIQVAAASKGGTLARAPVVLEWFGDEDLPDSRWTSRAVSTPDRIVTPSELVRTEVRERGADVDDTQAVPQSIDASLVESVEPSEAADVVYAREMDDDANVQSLLLGLAELRQRDWSATIIGDGPRREEFERQAADLRIDDRVTVAGDLPREERVAIYKGAHTFVQTAYRENFATELLWALACGCVGIVEYQADSSAHELIEHYQRSFRVTDDEGIAEAIADAGRFERRTMDAELAAEYDHSEFVEQYLSTYRELVEEFGLF
jgi:glycosyltransferase involved in cell wall biosynthesis